MCRNLDCKRKNEMLPAEDFPRNKLTPDGLHSYCKCARPRFQLNQCVHYLRVLWPTCPTTGCLYERQPLWLPVNVLIEACRIDALLLLSMWSTGGGLRALAWPLQGVQAETGQRKPQEAQAGGRRRRRQGAREEGAAGQAGANTPSQAGLQSSLPLLTSTNREDWGLCRREQSVCCRVSQRRPAVRLRAGSDSVGPPGMQERAAQATGAFPEGGGAAGAPAQGGPLDPPTQQQLQQQQGAAGGAEQVLPCEGCGHLHPWGSMSAETGGWRCAACRAGAAQGAYPPAAHVRAPVLFWLND